MRNGFTLIELMLAMAISGILIAIAAPQLSDYNNNNKLRNAAKEFHAMLQFARSEAIKRNAIINLDTINPNGISGDDWSNDIVMCVILNAGDATTLCTHATDAQYIKTFNVANGVTIRSGAIGSNIISFNARGRLNLAGQVLIGFCDSRAATVADDQFLSINGPGRSRIKDLDTTVAVERCNPI